MRHCCWWVLVVTVLGVTGEKLGDLEVLTRDDLTTADLSPDTLSTNGGFATDGFVGEGFNGGDGRGPSFRVVTIGEDNLPTVIQNDPAPRPLPALTYLPPQQVPLPIESPEAPIILPDDSQISNIPSSFYVGPELESPDDAYTPVVVPGGGEVFPEAGEGEQIYVPSYPVQEEVYTIEEFGKEDKDFLTGIRDSKLALLGGVVGAKSAVAQGFKDAKESLVSGIRGAFTAKGQAFSSLTNKGSNKGSTYYYGGSSGGSESGYNYNVGSSGGSGSGYNYNVGSSGGSESGYNYNVGSADNYNGGSGGSGSDNTDNYYPIANTGGGDGSANSGHVIPVPYPIYPPYPQSYQPPRPAYPLIIYPARHLYRRKPIAAKKQAVADVIAGAIAKLKAPFQPRYHTYSYAYGRPPW